MYPPAHQYGTQNAIGAQGPVAELLTGYAVCSKDCDFLLFFENRLASELSHSCPTCSQQGEIVIKKAVVLQ